MYKFVFCFLSLFCALFSIELAQVIEIENVESENYSFVLNVDKNQEKIIREIILTMARSNLIKLGFKKKYLSGLGKKLNGLGPLQFLGFVGTKAELKKALIKISKSSLKWNGFVEGMSKGLDKAHSKKTLFRDLPGFASLVNIDEKILTQHAKNRDWSAFIQSIAIENTLESS